MNKIFLIIKGWIISQITRFKNWCVSLFTKEVPNTKNGLITTDDDSTQMNEFITTDDSTQIDWFLPEDEFEKSLLQVNKEMDINTVLMEDSEFDFTDTSQENSELQPLDIPLQQPEYLLYDGKYDTLFTTIEIPVPMSVVHEEIWDILQEKMPAHYTIPSPTSKNLYTTNQEIFKGA